MKGKGREKEVRDSRRGRVTLSFSIIAARTEEQNHREVDILTEREENEG